MKAILIINVFLVLALYSESVGAQKTFSAEFREKALAMGLDYIESTEGRLKYRPAGKNQIFKYDARILDKDKKIENFIIFKDEGSHSITRTPHIEFTRMIADMASNNEGDLIWAHILGRDETIAFGSDWAAEARFVPKGGITRYQKVRLVCLYKEGKGMASILYCYDGRPDLDGIIRFRSNNIKDDGS